MEHQLSLLPRGCSSQKSEEKSAVKGNQKELEHLLYFRRRSLNILAFFFLLGRKVWVDQDVTFTELSMALTSTWGHYLKLSCVLFVLILLAVNFIKWPYFFCTFRRSKERIFMSGTKLQIERDLEWMILVWMRSSCQQEARQKDASLYQNGSNGRYQKPVNYCKEGEEKMIICTCWFVPEGALAKQEKCWHNRSVYCSAFRPNCW